MQKLIFCLFTLFFTSYTWAQNPHAEIISQKAKDHAETIIDKNIEEQLLFTPPNIISMAGGDSLYKIILTQEASSFQDENIKYLKAEFSTPGDIVTAGAELHCTLERTLFIDFRGAKAEEKTTLLAISSDEGISWSFVDLNRHDKTSIKLFFPDFNDELLSALDK